MAMETELQKEGALAPLTPAKLIPARLGVESINREWKDHAGGSFPHANSMNCDPNISVDKNIGYVDGGGSGKDFADNVMAGKFSKKDSGNSEELPAAKNVAGSHEELTLDVLRNVSFFELLLAARQVNQQKMSEVKATSPSPSPCPGTPTNAEADANQSIPRNCIEVQTTPLPMNSQAEQHAIPISIFGIPPTPPPMNIQASPQAIEKNSVEIPPTPPAMNIQAARGAVQEKDFVILPTQAAHQDIPMSSFHIPATDQDGQGVNKKLRQPQQRRRMKKHRPKVVADGKLRKPPKTPKTPKTPKVSKTPKTPKTPKAPITPKREPCKRVLDFNSNEQDKVKDGEDDRVVLVPKDDLQEVVKNSPKGSENAEDRVEQEEDDRVVLVSDDLQEEVRNGSKGSKIAEDRVEQDQVKDEEADRVVLVLKDDLQEEVKNSPKGSENAEDRVEQDKVKDEEDDRVVLVLKDDLQEEVRNGSKGYENVEDEIEQDRVKDEKDDRVVLFLDDLQEEVKNGSKGSKIAEDGVQLDDIPDPEINPDDLLRKWVTSKRSAQMRKRRFMKVINKKGCSQNSLIVYARKFQPNQCQKNSRKLGPNFPRIFKKPRARRYKTTSIEILLSIIQVRKSGTNVTEPFKYVLSWGANCRRKRSKTLTRRWILSSPTAKIFTPDQSLHLFPGQDHGTVILPSLIDAPIYDQFSPYQPGQDLGIVNLPSPTAFGLNPESDKLSLPELGLVTPTHMNPNCDRSSPLVQNVGTSSLRIDCEQIIPPSSQEQGIVRHGIHTSMTKSGNKRPRLLTPRQKLSSPVKASIDDIEDFSPSSSNFARKLINVIQGLEAFHINNECNKQLVMQDQNANSALVKINPPKKPKQPSAKVDLDELTLRVWNLLMENKGTDPFKETDEENEQCWKEQREIFRRRINSFIHQMHEIQGNRSFSPWKGSVVDSIVGVYLTQNVSDHLSSSAFMNLAAKFPSKTTSETSQAEVIVCCQEPVGSNEEADGHIENQLDMGNQYGNIMKDEIPTTKSGPVSDIIPGEIFKGSFCDGKSDPVSDAIPGETLKGSFCDEKSDPASDAIPGENLKGSFCDGKSDTVPDAIPGETLKGSFCDGKSDPVADAISGEILKGSFLDGNADPVSDAIPGETLKRSFCDEKSVQVSDAISGEILKGSFLDGNADPVSEAIPGEILKGSFLDGNAAINEPCLRGPQHLDAVDHLQKTPNVPFDLNLPLWDPFGILGGKSIADRKKKRKHDADINDQNASLGKNGRGRNGVVRGKNTETTPKKKKTKAEEKPEMKIDWDELRQTYCREREGGRNINNKDSVDWEAVRCSTVDEISKTIKERGMNNVLARRIKGFLDRIYKDHESLDLEWLRDVPPDKAKEYLLSIDGLGLKSVECVRLLCLHHIAFPVDTNVARVAVRLGWTPIQPLAVMLHELNAYPLMDSIQKYLWPRLCNLSQKELYELHYQMITFGKVFCTMKNPNCNACPMRGECRHYASAEASRRGALPKPEEKRMTASNVPVAAGEMPSVVPTPPTNPSLLEFNISDSSNCEDHSCQPIIGPNVPVADQNPSVVVTPAETVFFQEINISDLGKYRDDDKICEPIIEVPPSPGPIDIETLLASDPDAVFDYPDDDEIPTLELNSDEFRENLRNILVSRNPLLQGEDLSRALVTLTEEAASYPVQEVKHVARLRTVHRVYELPDSHPLLTGFEGRHPDDVMPYLLAVWTSGEAVGPERCNESSCAPSTSIQECNPASVWGTILIPCRTATRGAFPLNGTYFQVNEVFADDETSREPIRIPKAWISDLHLRESLLYCGSAASSMLRGLSQQDIQFCFWRGYICVRGFNRRMRIPRRLNHKFHVNTTAAALEKKVEKKVEKVEKKVEQKRKKR